MVERYRRAKRKLRLLGNHQKCWIWGRNTVTETIAAGKWPMLELRLSDALSPADIDHWRSLASERQTPVFVEPPDVLRKLCRSGEHQGFLAKMTEFPYDTADDLLARRPPRPFYAILDSIQDPYNFGAILRSADALGVDGVIIGRDKQVGVTSLVARASAGAVNHVPLFQVVDLADFLRTLANEGIAVWIASHSAQRPAHECDFSQSSAVIIGNEGRGVREELLQLTDRRVTIPQYGRVASLNVATAASLLFYEAARQRAVSADAGHGVR